jgi:hypothetical protein
MMNVRYLTTITSVSAQKKSDRTPRTFGTVGRTPCPAAKHSRSA